jgi:hypothetical protein
VCLNVTIYPPDAVMPTVTRGDDDEDKEVETTEDPGCHPFYTELTDAGTAAENQIRSVTVFMVDLDEKDREQLTYDHIRAGSVYVQTTTLPTAGTTTGYNVTINLKTTTGRKHVYVGANLSDDQIECFRKDNRPVEYTHYTDANLKEIMSHFMTISDEQFTYTGSLISMFAKAAPKDIMTDATAADSIFVVTPSTGNDLLMIAVEKLQLERTVAKVLLTCLASQEAEGDADYADCISIKDQNETLRKEKDKDWKEATDQQLKEYFRGWAPKNGVFYMVNIAARTQRLLRDSVATLGNYVQQLSNYDFVAVDGDVYTRRYLSYTAKELALRSDQTTSGETYPFFSDALRRRAVIITSTDDEAAKTQARATKEGLYCLPNQFRFRRSDEYPNLWYGTVDKDGETFKLDSVAKKVATYMLVAVRYVPRTLRCLDKEGNYFYHTFTSMKEAEDSLHAATETIDGETTYYPKGTYWALVGQEGIDYYTFAAMKKYVQEGNYKTWALARFRCYEAGYGYYISYIDAARCDDSTSPYYKDVYGMVSYDYDVKVKNPKVPRQDRIFGLSRNHYYILRTEEITVPGASALSGTMRLNAVLLDWNDRGSTDVEITPGGND